MHPFLAIGLRFDRILQIRAVSLFLFLLFSCAFCSFAQTLTTAEEQLALEQARRLYPDRETIALNRVALPDHVSVAAYNIGVGEGFVLVSAHPNATRYVLGYSREGTFDYNQAPPAVKELLSVLNPMACRHTSKRNYTPTGPVIKTKWGQNAPYNLYAPTINGTTAPTGCGATSMAQVVAHYGYPQKAVGLVSYTSANSQTDFVVSLDTIPLDWNLLLESYGAGYTPAEAEAVARLMYACGVSMQTNYGVSGSSAYLNKLEFSLRRYFGYQAFSRNQVINQIPQDEWHAYIAKDMQEGLPIIYLANTNGYGGHIFVLDGIDAEGLIHVNWGWTGYANGYYALGFFNPQDQGRGYNDNAIMITGIRPATTETEEEGCLSWSTTPFSYTGDNKKSDYAVAHLYTAEDLLLYAGQSIEAIAFFPGEAQCVYKLCIWGDATRQEVLYEQNVTVEKAGEPMRVTLTTPFLIPTGKDLYIGYTAQAEKGYPLGVDVGPAVLEKGDLFVLNPSDGAPFASINNGKATPMDFNFYIRAFLSETNAITAIPAFYSIYPNPATDYITVIAREGVLEDGFLILQDMYGRILSKTVMSGSSATIDLRQLPAGTYFIHDGNRAEKIIKH